MAIATSQRPAQDESEEVAEQAVVLPRSFLPRPRRSPMSTLLGAVVLVLVGAVVVAPIAFMLVQSFNVAGLGNSFEPGLGAWDALFGSERTLDSLGHTFVLAMRVPAAVLLGAGIAWFLARTQIRFKRVVEYSLWLAFFLPTVPVVLGWIVLADPHTGLINDWLSALPGSPSVNIYSLTGIFWVHLTLTTVPIMAIFLAPAFQQMDVSLEEAAHMSGATTMQSLRRVSLPLIKVAVLAATVIGFIRSLEVFEVEEILGTPAGVDVYATRIFDQIGSDPPLFSEAMALGAVMLITLVVLALLNQLLTKRWGDVATVGGKSVRSQLRRSGAVDRIVMGVILVGLAVGLYLPLAVVLLGSVRWRFGFFSRGDWTTEHWVVTLQDSAFTESLRNSFLVAAGTAFLGIALYAVLAWIIARKRIAFSRWLAVLCWLPWAVPGLLLGFAWTSLILGTGPGGLVYGTLVPLVAVLIIKELPLGVSMLRSAMSQVSAELEEPAVMAGATQWVVFRRILLPLITPMLATVFVFTFMMSLRDIAATVMLATPGTRTLSLLLFEYAVAGSYESAAVIGLLMAAMASLVALLALRVMRKHSLTGM